MRNLTGNSKVFVDIVASAFALYFIYAVFVTVPFYIMTPAYVCLSFALAFCLYPFRRGTEQSVISVVDILLILVSIGVTAYFMSQYDWYVRKPGLFRPLDIAMGIVAIFLSIEVCRRVLGNSLPILAVLAIAYAMYGNHLPGALGHRGYNLDRVVGQIFSFDGIYGSVARVYSTYVLLFVIFGAVLQACGMSSFLLDLSRALVGGLTGGIAKTAVVSSGALGSVVGSGAANIAVTGSFTIPVMKRSGYPAHYAGAIETVASTGGALMPPVMGSAAFLLASFTNTSYSQVVLYSFLPAILFYWGIYSQVHLMSKKLPLDAELSTESALSVIKRGWHMFLPIALIFVLIFQGVSPYRAALWSIATMIILHYAFPYTGRRMAPLELLRTFGEGAKLQVAVGASAGVIGIVVCMLVLPGLPLKIGSFAVAQAQGNLLVLLGMMIITSYIFGMGIPAVASYIILSILAVPALIEAGLPLFTSHLIIMWFSLSALWTPPVAVGAFVAGGIAGAPPSRIGWVSVRLGIGLYIIPVLMAFGHIIDGTPVQILFAGVCVAVGLYGFAAAVEGYCSRHINMAERAAFAVASVMTMYPHMGLRLAGLVVFVALIGWCRVTAKRLAQTGAAPTGAEPSTDTGQ